MGKSLLMLSMALAPLGFAHAADSTFTNTPLPNSSSPAPAAPVKNAPVAAASHDPEPVGNFTAIDALINDASREVTMLQQCRKETERLKADHAAKQRELKTEFDGKIPPAFNNLLMAKSRRAAKQQAFCLQESPRVDQIYTQAHELLRSFEPKSLPGIAVRGKKLNAVKARYNQMFPSGKAAKE